jgi:hypothetical protein
VPRPLGAALLAVVNDETLDLYETENRRPIRRRIEPENGLGNRTCRQQESQLCNALRILLWTKFRVGNLRS